MSRRIYWTNDDAVKLCDYLEGLENDHQDHEARIEALEKGPKGGISYVCAECHAFTNTPEYSLDCGTMFKCSKCGKATIINLQTQDEYAKTVNMLADGW